MTTASAYTTTLNSITYEYPFERCISILLYLFDEVVVADGGSTDGTLEKLEEMAALDPKLKVYSRPVDLNHPRWAILSDGLLKAEARKMCTKDALWQIDNDQLLCPSPANKDVVKMTSKTCIERMIAIALEQVEFWGDPKVARADLSPKPMVSPNLEGLTHGIKAGSEMKDEDGLTYIKPYMSDSCDLIWESNAQLFYPIGRLAFSPKIYHTSWLDLQRKVWHYTSLWPDFHKSMYNLSSDHDAMFGKSLDCVTYEDILSKVVELKQKGPRSFHTYQEDWKGETRELTKNEQEEFELINNYALLHK